MRFEIHIKDTTRIIKIRQVKFFSHVHGLATALKYPPQIRPCLKDFHGSPLVRKKNPITVREAPCPFCVLDLPILDFWAPCDEVGLCTR